MSQKRRHSLIEAIVGTAIGFVVSILASFIVYPIFGHSFTLAQNVGITVIFTFISVIRSYFVRRLFNWIHRPLPSSQNHWLDPPSDNSATIGQSVHKSYRG